MRNDFLECGGKALRDTALDRARLAGTVRLSKAVSRKALPPHSKIGGPK